jgi:hypothetical protein
MAFNSVTRLDLPIQQRNIGSQGTRTPSSLNGAYVHGVSGPGVATRFSAGSTAGLTEARIFLDLTTGTRANVSLRARMYTAAANGQPSTTLVATSDAITYPSADDRWVTASFSSPPALTRGNLYFVVWDNTASAPATDFPGILTQTNHGYGSLNAFSVAGYTTANGFSTGGSVQLEMPAIFSFNNGLNTGQPFTQQGVVFANNTLWRGSVFPNRVKNYPIFAFVCNPTTPTEFRIYRSNQLPGDTPIFSQSISAGERVSQICYLDPPLTLTGSADFYIVQNASVNSTAPNHGQIEDYSSISATIDEMLNDNLGFCTGVQDNGANGWNLFPTSFPAGGWLFVDDRATGGGGGGLRLFPGFNGGLDG